MKTLAHISDVHFGREDPAIVEALLSALVQARPDVVVISGDLTQRAKKRQFRAARAFLRRLPNVPQLVVPGNHDVSTTNLVVRAFKPLERYRRYITPDLTPSYTDGELAIAGINTVRVLAAKDGRISARQVRIACEQLAAAPAGSLRIVVTHHPMDLPAANVEDVPVRRAAMAMRAFAEVRVDLFLSGHLHVGLSVATAGRYKLPGYSAVVLHAGTAVSTRTRGVPNAWNLLHLDADTIHITQMIFADEAFATGKQERYVRGAEGWALANSAALDKSRAASTTAASQTTPASQPASTSVG